MPKRKIKTITEELAYREKYFHDIRVIKDTDITCTSCGDELNVNTKQIFSHPLIGILQCETCWNHIKKIEVKFYEDKTETCYICGNSKKLYVCSIEDCYSAFCKGCIKRNVSLSLLDAEKRDWKCFVCNPKPIWNLRAICAVIMNSLCKKGNRRSKSEKHILPSQVQRIEKTKEIQKVLQTICDKEDDDNDNPRNYVSIFMRKADKNRQERISEEDLTDSNSEDSLLSSKDNKKGRSRDKKSRSARSGSIPRRSRLKEKIGSRKNQIPSDDDSTDTSMNEITKSNCDCVHLSDESDEYDATSKISKISKRISKNTRQQKEKANTKSKDNMKKRCDSTSESEDEVKYKTRSTKRSTSRATSHSSIDEPKRNELSKKRLSISRIPEDDLDNNSSNSSSKEFQKMKLQKVNRDKYSKRQLADLEIDHTKSPCEKNSANDKCEEDDKQSENFNDVKKILKECKQICSNFLIHIETIEQLYSKRNEEQLILKSTEKINKLKTVIEKKQTDLITCYRSWSKNRKKSGTKKSSKVVSNNEESLQEHEKRISNDDQGVNKDVSECDSEEIFSADETKSPQKMQVTRQVDASKKKNINGINIDDEDRPKDNDENSVEDNLASSPVLNPCKKKKTSTEQSNKKHLFSECDKSNNEEQLTDAITNTNTNDKQLNLNTDIHNNEIKIEDSPLRHGSKEMTLENERDKCYEKDILDESIDMFDMSFDVPENVEENRTEKETDVETNHDKRKYTSIDENLDTCQNSLQDEVSHKRKSKSLSFHNNEEERDSLDQNTVAPVFATNEEVQDNSKTSQKTNVDDSESLDDAEALAKKALLETDSDLSPIGNITEQIEDPTTNDINLTKKNNDAEDNDFDVNSVSTIIFSALENKMNENIEKDVVDEIETEITKKNIDKLDKKSHQELNSSDEDAKAEKAAKKALLESNSDDSTVLSTESGKVIDKKSETDSSEKNAKAKLALLASSNSESSTSESISSEKTSVSMSTKNTKRNHESESDEESIISKLKRRRLHLDKNPYYRKDKKLRMFCIVHVKRLSKEVLKRYSRALRMSREYLEQKALKSLVNLDKLEKKRKKNTKKDSNSSTDDDSSSKISKNANKRKGKVKDKQESLMDHLKRIENGDVLETIEMDSDSEELVHQIKKVDDLPMSNEALISEADKIAKENLLNSSDSNEKEIVIDSDDSVNKDNKDEETEKKKTKYQKESEEKTSKQDKKENSDWRRDKLLTMKLSDTDSEIEQKKWEKKQEKMENESKKNNSDSDDEEKSLKTNKKKKKIRRRIIDSDSDVKITDCSSDSESSFKVSSAKENSSDSDNTKKEKEKRRKRRKRDSNSSDTDSSEKKSKPKRKRIKKMASDSDSSDAEIKNSQGSTPGKSGRKNIRKVLKDKQVAEDTKLAAKEEEERLKRIAERQAVYNEMYEIRLAGEEKVDKLVLDFDTETKKELVTVHEELVKRLKPHQAQGIKFMWDACFESLERTKTTSGSGCIIAHCMGLGKTLQVVTLTYTLLTHEETGVKTVLIVCPLSTVLNWLNEYNTWLKDLDDDIHVYELTKFRKNFERKCQLQRWQKTGGVLIIGYEMFRNLTGSSRNIRKGMKEVILECLVNPGADLVVCDEGHLLKNEDTALSKCMRSVKTMRRIVLTGTPLQNNLIEYHCMVQFVKPNLLGTKKEFLNRFVNPITNGQFDDSTAYDVKLMKKRAHVLHKMLEGSVQRFDYSVLTPFLPPKQEYVIFVRLTKTQIEMYQYYLENLARRQGGQGGTLFADFQALQRIWTHPVVLRLNAEKIEKANEKKLLSESEGSLKDFINDDTTDVDSDSSNNNSSSDSDVQAVDEENTNVSKRRTRNNPGESEESEEEVKKEETEWWSQFVQSEHFEDIRVSAKLLLLFGILKESEQIGDKVLVFSQSLYSLTLIEEFLKRIDDQTQEGTTNDALDNHTGNWQLGLDYFRLDGQTSAENRSIWCKIFNKPTNTRARLFLISTRAGGLGINLTAANRVIIFDASWNPSHDVQSIFRIYRFGQKKPCYVYRFLAAGTMEEKIYNRQVTKLSLSCRVVDEQQIERHYSNHNLNELYTFEPYSDEEKPTLNLPKDRLLAEIFLKYKDLVENYHEHDSLLENKAEEELDEEERKQAWLEYEEEKKGRPLINPINTAYQNNMLLQQQYMMNLVQSNMVPQNMSLQNEYENLQNLIRKDYPNATPEQQKLIANRALMEMYTYWEKQAAVYNKQSVQPIRHPAVMSNFQRPQTPNFQQRPQILNNSNIHQQNSQLQFLLGQSTNYANKPVQSNSAQIGEVVPNLFTYQNAPAPSAASNNAGGNMDQDVIEVPTVSNTAVTRQSGMNSAQVAAQPIDNSKIQEE
ncbi:hypothetical protein P5V15_012144 [Pogonomyrmex californicus]